MRIRVGKVDGLDEDGLDEDGLAGRRPNSNFVSARIRPRERA